MNPQYEHLRAAGGDYPPPCRYAMSIVCRGQVLNGPKKRNYIAKGHDVHYETGFGQNRTASMNTFVPRLTIVIFLGEKVVSEECGRWNLVSWKADELGCAVNGVAPLLFLTNSKRVKTVYFNAFCGCFLLLFICTTCWVTLLNMLINLAQHVVQISIDWIREVCHLGRMAYCAGRGRSLRGYREIAAVASLRIPSGCEI